MTLGEIKGLYQIDAVREKWIKKEVSTEDYAKECTYFELAHPGWHVYYFAEIGRHCIAPSHDRKGLIARV